MDEFVEQRDGRRERGSWIGGRITRYEVDAWAEVMVQDGSILFRGRVLDLSQGGCYVETEARLRLAPGTRWRWCFGVGDRVFRCEATSRMLARAGGISFEGHGCRRHETELEGLIDELERVERKPSLGRLGGVVDDDLPAVIGVFEDQGEEAFGDAAVFLAAVEVVFADDDCEVLVEGMDLEVGVAQGAHRGSVGVVVLVLVDEAGESTEDLVGDEKVSGESL